MAWAEPGANTPRPGFGDGPGGERVRESLGLLVEMFESGSAAGASLADAVAQTFITAAEDLEKAPPSARWSLSNRLLMWLADTEDARGFRQWQKVGRSVRKGARAFYILAPVLRKVAKVRVEDEGGEAEEEFRREVLVGFKAIPVFRLEDTEGEDLEGEARPDYTPPASQTPPLFEVAAALGVSVEYAPVASGARAAGSRKAGSYRLTGDKITLHSHDARTFLHELAHAGHDRITPGGLKSRADAAAYARQEVVAETAAAALCLIYGLEGFVPHSKEYIASYAKEGVGSGSAARAVLRVLSEVENTLTYLLEPSRRPTLEARGNRRLASSSATGYPKPLKEAG